MDLEQHILLSLNAIVCAVIVIRLITFERRNFQFSYSWFFSTIVYLLVISNATIVIRTLTGDMAHLDWTCLMNNLLLCVALIMLRGNIRALLGKPAGKKQIRNKSTQ